MAERIIEIWEPKWKDRTVLVSCGKVRKGINKVKFTKCKTLQGIYTFIGDEVKQRCPVVSNGKIDCYAIPIYMLVREDDGSQLTLY